MPSLREFYYSDFYQGRAQNRVCQHQHTTIFPLALSLPRMQAIKFQSKRTNQVVFFGISIFLLSVFLLFFLNGMFYLFFFSALALVPITRLSVVSMVRTVCHLHYM